MTATTVSLDLLCSLRECGREAESTYRSLAGRIARGENPNQGEIRRILIDAGRAVPELLDDVAWLQQRADAKASLARVPDLESQLPQLQEDANTAATHLKTVAAEYETRLRDAKESLRIAESAYRAARDEAGHVRRNASRILLAGNPRWQPIGIPFLVADPHPEAAADRNDLPAFVRVVAVAARIERIMQSKTNTTDAIESLKVRVKEQRERVAAGGYANARFDHAQKEQASILASLERNLAAAEAERVRVEAEAATLPALREQLAVLQEEAKRETGVPAGPMPLWEVSLDGQRPRLIEAPDSAAVVLVYKSLAGIRSTSNMFQVGRVDGGLVNGSSDGPGSDSQDGHQ